MLKEVAMGYIERSTASFILMFIICMSRLAYFLADYALQLHTSKLLTQSGCQPHNTEI
jgi:hypothetical protein